MRRFVFRWSALEVLSFFLLPFLLWSVVQRYTHKVACLKTVAQGCADQILNSSYYSNMNSLNILDKNFKIKNALKSKILALTSYDNCKFLHIVSHDNIIKMQAYLDMRVYSYSYYNLCCIQLSSLRGLLLSERKWRISGFGVEESVCG